MLWFAPEKTGLVGQNSIRAVSKSSSSAGLMTPAGLPKIQAAKQDGSWNALDRIEELEISPDLAEALAANKTAQTYFNEFPRSAKRAILEWIANAKKPDTRAKRIQETVTSAAKKIRAN